MTPSDLSEILTIAAPPELEAIPDLDAGNVVEEAEQMLRESAPHDFDLLVIGGGPGGMAAAIRAAELGAHVGLIEQTKVGGAHLHQNCVPAKTLMESVEVLRQIRRARAFGISVGEAKIDFPAMQQRKREIVARLQANLEESLREHSIEMIIGRARFVGEHVVEIESDGQTRRVNAVHIVIAAGSTVARGAISGADSPGVVTPDEILQIEIVPQSLVVIGAGAVGIELANLFAELGARVTILEASPQILPEEDSDIASEMEKLLGARGLNIVTGAAVKRIEAKDGALNIVFSVRNANRKTEKTFPTQMVLLAAARRPNTQILNLEEAGIAHDDGKIAVDENCETSVAGVYAIGDCVRANGWEHLAEGEGILVAERIMRHPQTVDLAHVPRCYRTHPEIACAGLTQSQAEAKGIRARSGTSAFRSNEKAVMAGDEGWIKIVIEDESEILLGCQIIGRGASELINLAVLALKTGQTAGELASAVFAHPTLGEAVPQAARMARKRTFED